MSSGFKYEVCTMPGRAGGVRTAVAVGGRDVSVAAGVAVGALICAKAVSIAAVIAVSGVGAAGAHEASSAVNRLRTRNRCVILNP